MQLIEDNGTITFGSDPFSKKFNKALLFFYLEVEVRTLKQLTALPLEKIQFLSQNVVLFFQILE